MFDGTASHTSTSLLREAQRGNDGAWQRLVEMYGRRVYRWCRRSGLQPEDASNVVQEVLRAVSRSLDRFQRQQTSGSFRAWIRQITQNKVRDHFRLELRRIDAPRGGSDAHRRLTTIAQRAADHSDSAHGMSDESREEIERRLAAVERLRSEFSDRDWRFFWRVAVDGQSAAEVAREFGVTANAVRIVKMRVLKRLRDKLSVLRSDDPTP